jgi:hypothetical protein
MTAMRYAEYLVTLAAVVAALLYIGRKVGQVAIILRLLARLPDEHQQLLEATKVNTSNIADLTKQVSRLTSDVAKLAGT